MTAEVNVTTPTVWQSLGQVRQGLQVFYAVTSMRDRAGPVLEQRIFAEAGNLADARADKGEGVAILSEVYPIPDAPAAAGDQPVHEAGRERLPARVRHVAVDGRHPAAADRDAVYQLGEPPCKTVICSAASSS